MAEMKKKGKQQFDDEATTERIHSKTKERKAAQKRETNRRLAGQGMAALASVTPEVLIKRAEEVAKPAETIVAKPVVEEVVDTLITIEEGDLDELYLEFLPELEAIEKGEVMISLVEKAESDEAEALDLIDTAKSNIKAWTKQYQDLQAMIEKQRAAFRKKVLSEPLSVVNAEKLQKWGAKMFMERLEDYVSKREEAAFKAQKDEIWAIQHRINDTELAIAKTQEEAEALKALKAEHKAKANEIFQAAGLKLPYASKA